MKSLDKETRAEIEMALDSLEFASMNVPTEDTQAGEIAYLSLRCFHHLEDAEDILRNILEYGEELSEDE